MATGTRLRLIDTQNLDSFAAPADRDSTDRVRLQYEIFNKDQVYRQIINLMPNMVMVLNDKRQIIFANRAVLDQFDGEDNVIGARVGEIFSSVNSSEMGADCGTAKNCRYCGSLRAQVKAIEGIESEEEWHLTYKSRGRLESKEFRINASPLEKEGQHFVFYVLTEIEDEKRRQVMERVFLRDVLNTAVALRGYSNLSQAAGLDEETLKGFSNRVDDLACQIVDEISWHGDLLAAERDQLVLRLSEINSLDLTRKLAKRFHQSDFKGISIVVDDDTTDTRMVTDETILLRVLGNILKNALEASVPGEQVTIGCRQEEKGVCFWVNNPAYLSEEIRLRIFNRSYSTKGKGRGIGTYSAKYLTEKYLGGQVTVESQRTQGTTFSVYLIIENNRNR